jgi:hypothetical protein
MRLLDLVAQYRSPFVITPPGGAAPMLMNGPSDFARRVAGCPLRFVIEDNLTRASAELAFAEGDRLAGCLDLLRFPAPQMWVEWSDAIHQEVICQCGIVRQQDMNAGGRQVGLLLEASPCGKSAVARTFWSVPNSAGERDVIMSPLETHIHLEERFEPAMSAIEMLGGEFASVFCDEPGVAELLERVRFRFDDSWSKYYRINTVDTQTQESVARSSLAAVAHDIPLLLAFFLFLNAKGATRAIPVQRAQLNRKRHARDRPPLLDHVEVHASLPTHSSAGSEEHLAQFTRRPPRLHHVRGHLVRREDRVFWRTPHLRGSARQGVVRSRTVCLSFARAS